MSTSLRDQLIQAGLVDRKKAKQLQQEQQRQTFQGQHGQSVATSQATQDTAAAKAARDQELNRRRQEHAQLKARWAEIKQLVEQHRLPRIEDGEDYYFTDDKKVRRLTVNATMREQLVRGELRITRLKNRYDLVPAAAAERIRERDERALVPLKSEAEAASADDPYAEHAVPENLRW
jgi:uncharacterized protein YaiL (DUF2058 family)